MPNDTVNGALSLSEQSDVIQNGEQANNIQLVSYQKGDAGKNDATFDKVPLGQDIAPLILLEVPPGDITDIENAQKTEGRKLVFNSDVFVKGDVKRVAGFR